MKNYPTIESAILEAKNNTGALRITKTTDGANLVQTGYDFFGNVCFNIYKTYCNNYTQKYIVRYPNN